MLNQLLAQCSGGPGGECPPGRAGSGNGIINNPATGTTLQNAVANGSGPIPFLSTILTNLVTLTFIVGSVIFFFMLVSGAIQWIASGGDKQGLEAAKGRISNAIIGIVILLSTFAVIKLIEIFFGIKILTIDIGPLVIQ